MNKLTSLTLTVLLLAPLAATGQAAGTPPVAVEARVSDLLAKMTLKEKCGMLCGVRGFYIPGVPRLGIPEATTSDGPLGVHYDRECYPNRSKSTSYPATIGLAAGFNPDLARQYGEVVGRECRARGVHFLLAPGVNIYRLPVCGRNFEYFGEDPFLAVATPFIQGVQSQGGAATVNHFFGNNQEWARRTVSSDIDERTMREIYLPAFERAVKEGKVWSVMAAYNLVNGVHMTENRPFQINLLKKEWDFQGSIMSDWGACHNVVEAANGGLDIEMGSAHWSKDQALLKSVQQGQVQKSVIDDKVRRILRCYVALGFLDRPQLVPAKSLESAEGDQTALRIAREGIVLLKNDAILPLSPQTAETVAVIGRNAVYRSLIGGGSSGVHAFQCTDALTGITLAAGKQVKVSYSKGDNLDETVKLARSAKQVVLFVGFDQTTEMEGRDRTFALPNDQNGLIRKVAAANPDTIVVINSGGNVEMTSWINQVKAVLMAWYPGQEGGRALGEILFGQTNPSGKLPATFEIKLEDNPAFRNYWAKGKRKRVAYKEGIFVGYRGYDHNKIEPRFPFGFGLSYTTFTIGQPMLSTATLRSSDTLSVSVQVTNTGKRAGAEVVQLYIAGHEASVPRPPKELKGFQKVFLQPGASTTVQFKVTARDLSFWDVTSHGWKAEPGSFEVQIGNSSRNLMRKATFELTAR